MRVQDQPAYILHHRPFRETSQILDIISRDYGRLSLMSRGSRAAKSRLKSTLQPFTPLLVNWSGKGEMPLLVGAEIQAVEHIAVAGRALPCAFYMNELLLGLVHKHDVHEGAFYLYESVLKLLAADLPVEPVLRAFETRLLDVLGFGLNLVSDAETGQAVEADCEYAYYLELGPVEISRVQDEAYIHRLSGRSLMDLDSNTLDSAQSLKDARRLMRSVLHYYLGGKLIKSRELFR